MEPSGREKAFRPRKKKRDRREDSLVEQLHQCGSTMISLTTLPADHLSHRGSPQSLLGALHERRPGHSGGPERGLDSRRLR
jgi:hypothetical protein